jgi:hypothetical protein
MATFFGTVIIFGLSCLAMSVGLIITGRPLTGGCGKNEPGVLRCEGCPKRISKTAVENHGGESEC